MGCTARFRKPPISSRAAGEPVKSFTVRVSSLPSLQRGKAEYGNKAGHAEKKKGADLCRQREKIAEKARKGRAAR